MTAVCSVYVGGRGVDYRSFVLFFLFCGSMTTYHLGKLEIVEVDRPRRGTPSARRPRRWLWQWGDVVRSLDEPRLPQLRENSFRVEQTVDRDDQLE